MVHSDTPGADRFTAFRHPSFGFYWFAKFFSTFGMQIIAVAVGWQIYDLTRNPFDLGIIGLVQFLPALLLILVTGAASDRYGRRLIMGVCEIVSLGVAAILVVLTLRGITSPVPIFGVLLGPGHCPGVLQPGRYGADAQSGAGIRSCQRHRLEFHVLADGDHCRSGCRRTALRPRRDGAPLDQPGFVRHCVGADLRNSQARAKAWRAPPGYERPCRLAFVSSDAKRSCSTPFRSTCSPCFWAAPSR